MGYIQILQLIMSLSILVLVHEFGHFLFARIFKVRVEKFYLFFDAGFALFRHKPKKSDTEYGIGWLPLGGYCKISGMIDESMDTEQLKSDPQPWEFRYKPAWQRLLIMLGGVMFNVILAFFIYTGMLTFWGNEYLANKDVKYGIACDSIALDMGFRNGDKVLTVNGEEVNSFLDIQKRMMLYKQMNITLLRGNETVNISPDYDTYIPYMLRNRIIEPMIPFIIKEIPDTSINKASALRAGDEIIGIEGVKRNFTEIRECLKITKGGTLLANVLRNSEQHDILLNVSEQGFIEVGLETDPSKFFPIVEERYNFFQAFPAATVKAKNRLRDQLCEVRLMFTPKTEAYKQVGSFISIGKIYSKTWDWHRFWDMTALLSIMLAVLNLLPIPALDGGHVMFLLYEAVTRRKPSDKFLTYAQVTGMVILIALMVYAFGNDIVRHFLN